MTIQEWTFVPQGEVGTAYYHRTYKGYEIELHDVNGGIDVGVYKKGTLLKVLRLEIQTEEFHNRYEAIMTCVDDLVTSLE